MFVSRRKYRRALDEIAHREYLFDELYDSSKTFLEALVIVVDNAQGLANALQVISEIQYLDEELYAKIDELLEKWEDVRERCSPADVLWQWVNDLNIEDTIERETENMDDVIRRLTEEEAQ